MSVIYADFRLREIKADQRKLTRRAARTPISLASRPVSALNCRLPTPQSWVDQAKQDGLLDQLKAVLGAQ